MRVAIVHYHLDAGGVSQVIQRTSALLHARGISHVILVGNRRLDRDFSSSTIAETSKSKDPSGSYLPLPVHEIPGLGYRTDEPSDAVKTAELLLEHMIQAAIDALGGLPDLWHFHNHSLGKNSLLPRVIRLLARSGARMLLHIHDLAEQGRPENYPFVARHLEIYPFASHIHYAFLNSRDQEIFTAAGLPHECAHFLPNSIDLRGSAISSVASSPLLFAPIRGIRRKNLGELVLLSALAPPGTRIATSRAPRNAAALGLHDAWNKFATHHRLPIDFNVVDRIAPFPGASTDFDSWVAHSTHFVSTSVSEGFGLSFLESIAHGKPLVGRSLPHLVQDYTLHGVHFSNLYEQILIPLDWVDLSLLQDHLQRAMVRTWRAYGVSLPTHAINDTFSNIIQDSWLDFGNLPESLQESLIERALDPLERSSLHVRTRGGVFPLNRWLPPVLSLRSPAFSQQVLAPWLPHIYAKKLIGIYQKIDSETAFLPLQHLSPEQILSRSLTPASFHFLLSASTILKKPRRFKAVVFDIYGTLLEAQAGGVKHDPGMDPLLRDVILQWGYKPPLSPSAELYAAVVRHHTASAELYPEVDLRALWREILALPVQTDTTSLVQAIEAIWHPSSPISGASDFVRKLFSEGISLGLLSNAQSNTLNTLGDLADFFSPELTILSYQHAIAKPSFALFQTLVNRLEAKGISPAETLYVGNDPLLDIVPAHGIGLQTALFIGHPASLRPGNCKPNISFRSWEELATWISV